MGLQYKTPRYSFQNTVYPQVLAKGGSLCTMSCWADIMVRGFLSSRACLVLCLQSQCGTCALLLITICFIEFQYLAAMMAWKETARHKGNIDFLNSRSCFLLTDGRWHSVNLIRFQLSCLFAVLPPPLYLEDMEAYQSLALLSHSPRLICSCHIARPGIPLL